MESSVLITVLFLAFLSPSAFAQSDSCDPSKVENCIGEIKQLYHNQDGPIIVKNERELQTLCGHQQRALECISSFVDRCLSEKHQTLYNNLTSGVHDFIRDFCEDNSRTRKIYIKHLSCFNKVADKVHHCSMRLNEWQKTAHEKAQEKEVYFRETCCHFGQAMTCMKTVVEDGCPEEAHKLFSDMVNKISLQFTRVAQCDINLMQSQQQCSSASWSQLSIGLFLASLILTILRRS